MTELSVERSRFVVLWHRVGAGFDSVRADHMDWMFQRGEVLRTWATRPIRHWEKTFTIDGQSLADHRSKYLDYEGCISGDRGHVSQVISGTFVLDCETESQFRVIADCGISSVPLRASIRFQRIVLDRERSEDDQRSCWSVTWSPLS